MANLVNSEIDQKPETSLPRTSQTFQALKNKQDGRGGMAYPDIFGISHKTGLFFDVVVIVQPYHFF